MTIDDTNRSRFDPTYRARNWRYLPSMERRGRNILQDIKDVKFHLTGLGQSATEDLGFPAIEQLTELPVPTEGDIGRFIQVRLPGEITTSTYVGILLPDDTVIWQLVAQGEGVPPSGIAASFSFVGTADVGLGDGTGSWALDMDDLSVFYIYDTFDMRRYNRSTDNTTTFFAAFPSGAVVGRGVVIQSTDACGYNIVVATSGNCQRATHNPSNCNGQTATSGATNNFGGITSRSVDGKLYACTIDTGDVLRLHPTTLATEATVLNTTRQFSGIYYDGFGDAFYLCDQLNDTISRYTSSWSEVWTVGSTGAGAGQLDNPQGIATDASIVYVADRDNNRLALFDKDNGDFLGVITDNIHTPGDVAVFGTSIVTTHSANRDLVFYERVA